MRRGQRSEASRFLLKMHLLSAPDSVRFSHSTTDRYPLPHPYGHSEAADGGDNGEQWPRWWESGRRTDGG